MRRAACAMISIISIFWHISLDARPAIGVCRKKLSHGTNIECRFWKGWEKEKKYRPHGWVFIPAPVLEPPVRCSDAVKSEEEGYEYLERVFEVFPKWNSIPDGEEMDTGNP